MLSVLPSLHRRSALILFLRPEPALLAINLLTIGKSPVVLFIGVDHVVVVPLVSEEEHSSI